MQASTPRTRGKRSALKAMLLLAAAAGVSVEAHPIKHLVVLLEENRSFDHMLGWFKMNNSQVDGLVPDKYFNYRDPNDTTTQKVYCTPNATYVAPFDPDHGVDETTDEIWGDLPISNTSAPMAGFVWHHRHYDRPGAVMEGFLPNAVPVMTALAAEGALFDRWFAAVPGPTQVNRLYAHSATSHGLGHNDVDRLIEGMPQKTIYQSLDEAGLDWRIYYEFATPVLELSRMREPKNLERMRPYDEFVLDALRGDLKPYTFIDPRYSPVAGRAANDQHPTHDVREGEKLLKEIYETLRKSPQWNETALLITYDEHGGFYDHVPTPLSVPNPDGLVSPTNPAFNFTRGGVRIPAILVSPWIDRNTLVHTPTKKPTPTSEYELSSIPATIKEIFNLTSFLTARDAWAAPFDDVFLKRSSPRTDMPHTLPAAPGLTPEEVEEEMRKPCNGLQFEMARIAGSLNDPEVATARKTLQFSSQAEVGEYMKQQTKQFYERQGVQWRFPDV